MDANAPFGFMNWRNCMFCCLFASMYEQTARRWLVDVLVQDDAEADLSLDVPHLASMGALQLVGCRACCAFRETS